MASQTPPMNGTGMPPRRHRSARFWPRLGWQAGGTAILLLLLVVLLQTSAPGAALVRSYFGREAEHDWFPRMEGWFRSALWLDTFDRWAFQETETPSVVVTASPPALPVEGTITRPFGSLPSPVDSRQIPHNGIDITAPPGTAVKAVAAGKVLRVQAEAGLGLVVELEHSPGFSTRYAGLAPQVVEGEPVRKGQTIGTTLADRPLHFEMWRNGTPVNPLP
ncbi:MAG: M23 family metallopeptidase [Clostridia bacterium]|nr:MAG: M23 family metallopeptidase [Clostridia bacterium]